MIQYSVKKHILKNGLCLLYCHTPNYVSFELSIHINTGARDEEHKVSGVSHFLEHMMFRGSLRYPNSRLLAQAMEQFGGETNAMTGIENTNYWIKGSAEKTCEAVEVFAEFFLNPNYADLEIERNVILQEMASDFNEEGLTVDTESLGMETLFDHQIGNPIIGNEESVRNISVEELEAKRKEFYIPSNCILTINTSESEDKVLAAVEKYFSHPWQHANTKVPERSNANSSIPDKAHLRKAQNSLRLQNNPDNQFAIKLVFPTIGNLSKDVIPVTFVQRILDDGICTRLPGNIREKFGLVYDISADSQFFQEIGTFSIDATVSEDCLTELLDKLGKELSMLFIEPPTKEEVDHIRYRYLFDLQQILETPSRLLSRKVSEYFLNSSFTIEDEINAVKEIQPEDVYRAAKNIFSASKRAFVLVGPKARKKREIVEKFLSNFDMLGEVK